MIANDSYLWNRSGIIGFNQGLFQAELGGVSQPLPQASISAPTSSAQFLKNYSWPSVLLGILFSIVLPVLLYHFRALDNNSLCRWEWVFRDGPPLLLYGVTVVTAGAALFLSRLAWPGRKPLFLGVIAFLVGISLWGEPELIMDASRYFSQAKYLEVHGIKAFWQGWGGEISAWTDLPLIPFLYGLVFAGLGEARIFIQILTTCFFVGAVLLTYLYGKDLRDEETGFLAGLLLLCHPYLLLQIPLMMVDLPTLFFLILTLYTFSRALRDGGHRSIALAACAIFLLFWAKYSAWLLLTVLPVIVLARSPADYKKAGWAAAKTLALVLLFSLPLLIGLWEVVWAQLKLLVEYQRPGLSRWSESFFSTFFFQIHPLVSLAALSGLGIGLYKKDKRLIGPAYLLFLLLIILEVKRIRYLVPIFPLLAVAAACGLRRLPGQRLRKFLVLSALGGSLTLVFGGFLPFTGELSTTNIQQSGRFLNSLAAEEIAVYTAPQSARNPNLLINIPLLDLFTNKRIYSLNGLVDAEPPALEMKSSFRFTWEQQLPDFYRPPEGALNKAAPLVVIYSRTPRLPAAIRERVSRYRQVRAFEQSSDLFGYKTLVKVYFDE